MDFDAGHFPVLRLRAPAAVFRALARLDVDDAAEIVGAGRHLPRDGLGRVEKILTRAGGEHKEFGFA